MDGEGAQPTSAHGRHPNDQAADQSRAPIGGALQFNHTRSHQLAPPRIPRNEDVPNEGRTVIADVNPMTKAIEYYGDTSSVAFIGRLREEYNHVNGKSQELGSTEKQSLVGTFHNRMFSSRSASIAKELNEERFYAPQSYAFLDAYFNSLHYIHPIVDRDLFFRQCDDLWQGHSQRQSSGFIALYLSVLSLGALVRTWNNERIKDMGRFEWSHMLFERAELALGKPGLNNDLESIQALFVMAKICQNELNPKLAYMYLGMAIRASLSAGLNRDIPSNGGRAIEGLHTLAMSRTWWSLYSFEIELSFALGRPDSLGLDEYHNRPKPPLDDSEVAIVTSMIDLARIIRNISIRIYLANASWAEKLSRSFLTEANMDDWIERLPKTIRPSMTPDVHQNGTLRDPAWAPLQRLVLQLRYYNVKMLLLRPFMFHAAKLSPNRSLSTSLKEAVTKCVNAAVGTIETIYETCRVHSFFRTWWDNTTYITFAASILLFRAALTTDLTVDNTDYIQVVQKSLDLLDAMKESVVASKTAGVLRQIISRLRKRETSGSSANGDRTSSCQAILEVVPIGPPLPLAAEPALPLESISVFNLGSEYWDPSMWNWGRDLNAGWESEPDTDMA